MKHPFLLASAAANFALLAVFAFRPVLAPPVMRETFQRYSPFASAPAEPTAGAKPARPVPVAAKKDPLWPKLATDDLRTLIARLRAAGFPPDMIRTIISAEVYARYEPRMQALQSYDPNIPFWRQGTSPLNDPKRREAYIALQQERNRALRDLFKDEQLAPPTSTANAPAWAANLTPKQVDLLQRIETDYSEMMATARASMTYITLPEDRNKLALLTQAKRADLASVLSPDQLAEYELATSPITRSIGSRLGNFEPSDAEFRAIYNTYNALSEKYSAGLSGLTTADRQAMTTQVTEQLQAALGPTRYAEYVRETSSDVQLLNRLATQEKLPADSVSQVLALRDTVERESNRIFDDPSLAVEDKRAALKQLAQTTRNQISATMGAAAPQVLTSNTFTILNNLERGYVVTTTRAPLVMIATANGTSSTGGGLNMSGRSLPPEPKR